MSKLTVKPNSSVISQQLLDLSQDNEAVINSSIVTEESGGMVAVTITAEDVDSLIPKLEQNYNFEVIASSPENHFVEGYVPTDLIPQLTALGKQGLMGVLPIIQPETNAGITTSQADFVHESDRVRDTQPNAYDGTGVTIGIMSDSYDNLGGAAGDIGTGDLPAAGVNVLQDLTKEDNEKNIVTGDGSDEGRAMAQLVHDLAPGSDLAFSSVFFGEADFAQQIRDLADPAKGNADVLVDDVYYFYEPYFQDGVISQAVDDVVTNNGVSYFSSAGNNDDESYESDDINFVTNATGPSITRFPGTYYDFNTGAEVDTTQDIELADGQEIRFIFQWDDPFYTTNGVDTDLDLYLLDASGTIVASSINDNIGIQTPLEDLQYTDVTTDGSSDLYELVIVNYGGGPDPGIIKYINRGDVPVSVEYPHDASTVFGHSAATHGQAVAAVAWLDQENPESFTSKGSTAFAFEADGTPLPAIEVRQTPDIAAIDGTNTTFFGNDIGVDADSFPNFFGTSAAAPHAAAVAALLKQSDSSLTPDEIYTRLQTTAKDIGDAGFDDLTGHGLINAYDAIYGAPIASNLDFSDDFESGVLGSAYETNTTGAGRIQVTTENGPVDEYHLTLDSAALGRNSLNEVILNFDATNFSNIWLSFDQKEFGDEDNSMSASFTGSENSDGVAISVDGTNWRSLVSLTGTNSTAAYQTHTFDLSTFASDNSLTLDSDVQIKFQQFDTHSIPSDGMAFDNIYIGNGLSVANEISDQTILLGSPFTFQFAENTFNDLDGDTLSYTASLSNDSTLPAWLDFDSNTRTFSSTSNPQSGDLNVHKIKVTASDGTNSVSDIFDLVVVDREVDGSTGGGYRGGNTNDALAGGDTPDIILAGGGDDVVGGQAGKDRLYGENGADKIEGGEDDDFISGGMDNDNISGGDGVDFLSGDEGEDIISGGNGNDVLMGGDGNDTLYGGAGIDRLSGFAGSDVFVLSGGDPNNIVYDYLDNTDSFGLELDSFTESTVQGVFDALSINQSGSSTTISYDNEILATVYNTTSTDLAVDDFTAF